MHIPELLNNFIDGILYGSSWRCCDDEQIATRNLILEFLSCPIVMSRGGAWESKNRTILPLHIIVNARANRRVFNRLRAQLQESGPALDERVQNKVEPVAQNAADRELEMQQLRAKMQEDMEHQVSLHKSMSEQAMACIKADFERKVYMFIGARFSSSLGSRKLKYLSDYLDSSNTILNLCAVLTTKVSHFMDELICQFMHLKPKCTRVCSSGAFAIDPFFEQ